MFGFMFETAKRYFASIENIVYEKRFLRTWNNVPLFYFTYFISLLRIIHFSNDSSNKLFLIEK